MHLGEEVTEVITNKHHHLFFSRGLGWRMHLGVEVTEVSTNKHHHLSLGPNAQRRPAQPLDSALSRGYAGISQSDCPAAAGVPVGWRDGALFSRPHDSSRLFH
jgi:hypothetical protein